MRKPARGFWSLWNISFGFFGIQIGFALQNANISRIFQSLGSSVDDLAILWVAGPVTGLIAQPIIGYFSDRTWTRFGRRRPYFMAGAVLAAAALLGMPNARILWIAAGLLWIMDTAFNIGVESFRAFVGDMLDRAQHTAGYAFQTVFIGAGAVAASLAPVILTHFFGIANTAPEGVIPPSVKYSFYLGAFALLAAVLWTILGTREYSPEEMRTFEAGGAEGGEDGEKEEAVVIPKHGPFWLAAGVLFEAAILSLGLDRTLHIIGTGLAAFGFLQILCSRLAAMGRGQNALCRIVSDLGAMPGTMRRLALVQFFSWSALFIMWIYTTPVVTRYAFGAADTASKAYNDGADWVGVMFAVYNGVAVLWAFAIPYLARKTGRKAAHMLGLLAGAAGYASFFVFRDPYLLLLSMIGVGIAWASILTMPYAILVNALPPRKIGIYIGIFNFFIVLPQLLVSSVMGAAMRAFFPDDPIRVMAVAAFVMAAAALAMLRVGEEGREENGEGAAVR